MGDYRAQIECDGGPNCQAPEHIEGCFAPERRYVQVRPGEVEALREQLRGAVEALQRIERLRAKWDAPDSGGEQAWAVVGSEAHKIASTFLGGQ